MEPSTLLAVLADPRLLYALIPIGIIALGLVTYEVAMAITISTLPRSRFKHKWTPQEHRRVIRVFGGVFSVWPISATLIVAHVYLPLFYAVVIDALVLLLIIWGARWLIAGLREKRLIMSGHCVKCFYDLRMSHDSDHCPECGTELHDHPTRSAGGKPKPAAPVS